MNQSQVEQLIGKKITQSFSFSSADDFEAYNNALAQLEAMGVSVGSMQRNSPIGLAFGDYSISKWSYLGEDLKELDGVMVATDGSFRNGSITVFLTDKPEEKV